MKRGINSITFFAWLLVCVSIGLGIYMGQTFRVPPSDAWRTTTAFNWWLMAYVVIGGVLSARSFLPLALS